VLKGCKTGVVVKKIDFILIFAKIREKVCYSADICCNDGRHPFTTNAKLKILIFGAGGSSIRPLGTIIQSCLKLRLFEIFSVNIDCF